MIVNYYYHHHQHHNQHYHHHQQLSEVEKSYKLLSGDHDALSNI